MPSFLKKYNFNFLLISIYFLGILLFKIKDILVKYGNKSEEITKIIMGLIICSVFYIFYKKLTSPSIIDTLKKHSVIKWETILFCSIVVGYAIFSLINVQISSSKNLILSILAILFWAFAEEILFRLFFINFFLKNKFSLKIAILLSSTLFALAHASSIFFYLDNWISFLSQVLFAFFIGIILACIYINSKNILLVGILHFVINLPTLMTTKTSVSVIDKTLFQEILGAFIFQLFLLPIYFFAIHLLRKSLKEKLA